MGCFKGAGEGVLTGDVEDAFCALGEQPERGAGSAASRTDW
jgi:hypothetical protein